MEEKEIKQLASKYLGNLYRDVSGVREHIAGSSAWLPKSELRDKLITLNDRHDIAGVEQLKNEWFKFTDAFEKMPEEVSANRKRLEVDQLACDLANKIIHKQRQLSEAVE